MRRSPIHPAWLVGAVTLFSLLAASAFRSSFGVLLEPLHQSFGWGIATTSGAASLNLIVYGISAPFAAAVMEHWGLRRTVTTSLYLVGVAAALSTFMTSAWQLWVLWGLVIGVGTGSLALTFGAIVANRWFVTHRGFVTGAFSAASAAGQVVFVPVIAQVVQGPGWRAAIWGVAVATLVAATACLLLLRDRPSDLGVEPLGHDAADPGQQQNRVAGLDAELDDPDARPVHPVKAALDVLCHNIASRPMLGLLFTFVVCGWSTNGIIQTHFVPAAHDHSMPMTMAANMLGLIGTFDVIGTIASGWLTDRYDPRILLAVYYGTRAASLVPINQMLANHITPSLWVWIVFYGLDWTATVPPTVALCREHFGLRDSGVAFGWVYAAHMVGAGLGASVSGSLREADGSYVKAWVLTACLCLAASIVALVIPRHRRDRGRGAAVVAGHGAEPLGHHG